MSCAKISKPISEEVYLELKSKILQNILKPGERLVETDIAQELQVSRTPVREALKLLEQENLVTYYPRRGSVVSEISIEDALELYEVREFIEGLAARLICMSISRKNIMLLEEIVENMEKSIQKEDHENLYKLHARWSETVIELTTNKYLKNQMIVLYENLGRLRKVSLYNWKHTIAAYEETKNTLQAIIGGNEDESEKKARLHVRKAKERFIANMSEKN